MGSSILARAFVQAYRQALSNASKNGVAQEAVQNIKAASKTMTEAEARQILGVTEDSSWKKIVQNYESLFERNAKNESFYLQSNLKFLFKNFNVVVSVLETSQTTQHTHTIL
ncbi:mitochondrial import inner membrane translocase subunit PAM16 like 2-like [Solanum lycopersicum]|uniref:mitochondrial import inner membrane translocase subunit PAM16 like 2-like n=1 Tax=Solanum lycopersicum TaxID=4081 RepID=UPI003748C160